MNQFDAHITDTKARIEAEAIRAASIRTEEVLNAGSPLLHVLRELSAAKEQQNTTYSPLEVKVDGRMLPGLLNKCRPLRIGEMENLMEYVESYSREWDPDATSMTDSKGDWIESSSKGSHVKQTVFPVEFSLKQLITNKPDPYTDVQLFEVNPTDTKEQEVYLVYRIVAPKSNNYNGTTYGSHSESPASYSLDIISGSDKLVNFIEKNLELFKNANHH